MPGFFESNYSEFRESFSMADQGRRRLRDNCWTYIDIVSPYRHKNRVQGRKTVSMPQSPRDTIEVGQNVFKASHTTFQTDEMLVLRRANALNTGGNLPLYRSPSKLQQLQEEVLGLTQEDLQKRNDQNFNAKSNKFEQVPKSDSIISIDRFEDNFDEENEEETKEMQVIAQDQSVTQKEIKDSLRKMHRNKRVFCQNPTIQRSRYQIDKLHNSCLQLNNRCQTRIQLLAQQMTGLRPTKLADHIKVGIPLNKERTMSEESYSRYLEENPPMEFQRRNTHDFGKKETPATALILSPRDL